MGMAGPAEQRGCIQQTGPASRPTKDEKHPRFRAASLNAGTLRDKEGEVVETLTRRRVNLCCLQETRLAWGTEANQTRPIVGKDSMYQLYWCGNEDGLGGVSILLAKKWTDKVFEV